jgi:hypothetical protein
MTLAENLTCQIPDAARREAIGRGLADPKKRLIWGMVFERRIAVANAPTSAASLAAGTVPLLATSGG